MMSISDILCSGRQLQGYAADSIAPGVQPPGKFMKEREASTPVDPVVCRGPAAHFTFQLPRPEQTPAARVFHFHPCEATARVFYFNRPAHEQALAAEIFCLYDDAIPLFLAARVFYLNRSDLAAGIFHIHHHAWADYYPRSLLQRTEVRLTQPEERGLLNTEHCIAIAHINACIREIAACFYRSTAAGAGVMPSPATESTVSSTALIGKRLS
jgi:hypothetical protein